ncbi:hypothetical protein IWT140_00432 [Secundilactobacillus pentosiphilus]|uniref:Uncharacterized protein n=1 Tax=Secundilactobacillus pentosiphilus TaxID=1714682 RepID=A0A1Z5IM42_9LACO|nr:hypothetical protein IWT140_00432 [Secundilactobacillus pentosiphilus]
MNVQHQNSCTHPRTGQYGNVQYVMGNTQHQLDGENFTMMLAHIVVTSGSYLDSIHLLIDTQT